MLDDGFIDEVKALRKKYPEEMKAMQTIGYKEANDFLSGRIKTRKIFSFVLFVPQDNMLKDKPLSSKVSL